jgi:flagellar biosynthesis/type III secretory pathway protein FliH
MTDVEARVEAMYGEAVEEFRGALIGFVARAQSAVEAWKADSERRVAGIVMEIARRALAQELSMSRESVLSLVKEALKEVVHGGEVVVRINPLDAGILLGKKDEILAACSTVRGIEIATDLGIEYGCRIETTGGVIDAEVGTYLDRLEEAAA